jgi:DNA/RNA-binding domain of Phe-tRNA-synthetase-like protein
MTAITLHDDVLADHPDAQIRFVLAHGLRNDEPWPKVAAEHQQLAERIAASTWQPLTEDSPQISSWHDAYRRFGTNPRRNRPSLDALSRRLGKSGQLPQITGAVDAYNLISVLHGTPAGAFDLDHLDAQVTIRPARAGDHFTPLGEPEKVEEPRTGEVVYAQGQQVLTRHWNYRDADATKVTAATRNAVFILERISAQAVPDEAMATAQQALADLLQPHSEHVHLAVIDAHTRTTSLTPNPQGASPHSAS